ncbi:MAG: cysteine--tRNA ligase [Armatimonadota bacterium]
MALKFLDTYTRKMEEFKPICENQVKMYTCGPTVYDYPHIGNYRAYTFEDILRRYLKYKGFQVMQVMNITDIEDKIIKKSMEEKLNVADITKKYTDAFFQDLNKLNIERAEIYPKATEHINEMVELIQTLMEKGYAYKAEDGSVYFSVEKFKDYGKLAHINTEELIKGVRISHDEYSKDNLSDFALWKAYDENDGDVFWETPLGKGRPGWHIECSAMSMKYLGNHFDIHTGGVDNIFPHHENEIAQSQAATGEKFVNYWMHNEHLLVDNKKMSKSLGNFYTIRDLVGKGFDPLAVRYLYISNHYRSKINFTLEGIASAQNTLEGLYGFIKKMKNSSREGRLHADLKNMINKTKEEFEAFMDDDLNTPRAIAAVFDFIRELNILYTNDKLTKDDAAAIISTLLGFDRVLGLNLNKGLAEDSFSEEVNKLIEERNSARKNKDFKTADRIRDRLQEMGIILEDKKDGTVNIISKGQHV